MEKRGQIAFEFIIIMGFVTFVIVGILAISFIYSNSVKEKIKTNQLENCANKMISTAESIFYSGRPSRATINCYLPESLRNLDIQEDILIFTIQSSSGISKIPYSSNVPLVSKNNVMNNGGLKKIKIEAITVGSTDQVDISPL